MPKKKGQKKANEAIFSHIKEHREDDYFVISDEEYDVMKTRKKHKHKCKPDDINTRPGVVYPEIIWYLISSFIQPEQIMTFALINKSTYAITKRESFWYSIYKRYCENNLKLPESLRIENNYRAYGLRQRVIRGLYYTYGVFSLWSINLCKYECRAHTLVGRIYLNSWFKKGPVNWSVYFKLKKQGETVNDKQNRVEANPEKDNKVLMVCCKNIYNIPPLMGMTLTSVRLTMAQGFTAQNLHLGFNRGHHNTTRNIVPSCSVILDSVVSIYVFDWWHPKYPYYEVKPPPLTDDCTPILDVDFFDLSDDDIHDL